MQKSTQLVILVLLTLVFTTANASNLRDFSGNKQSISDYAGKDKWLVVMLWAHDCHVCNQEAHQYVKFHSKHKDKDASVLGISLDGQEKKELAQEFKKRHKLNFPNLIGEADDIYQMFVQLTGKQRFGTPSFLIYGPSGELVAEQVGAVPTELIETFIKQETAAAATKPQ